MARRNQPNLFDDLAALPAPRADLVALARRIPSNIKFGVSTWTYDGWAGDVYHRPYRGAEPARRLEEYARYPLFGTVGIDSAYYEPPTEEALAAYARALPGGFPCVSKVWDRITAKRLDRQLNPDFLIVDLFKQAVLGPFARVFRDHAGRQDLLHVVAEVMRRRLEALLLVNDRLEGNAPGTIRALVEVMGGG